MTWIVGCIRPFCFFNDTATTEIYTLSLHDALPISRRDRRSPARDGGERRVGPAPIRRGGRAPVAGAPPAACLRPRGDDVLPRPPHSPPGRGGWRPRVRGEGTPPPRGAPPRSVPRRGRRSRC